MVRMLTKSWEDQYLIDQQRVQVEFSKDEQSILASLVLGICYDSIDHIIIVNLKMMAHLVKIFVLDLVLAYLVCSQSFSAYQLTFFQGVGSPTYYVYPQHNLTKTYPQPYDSSYQRGLALSGISFLVSNNISFAANIIATSDWADLVQLTINSDVGVYFVSFSLLLTSTSSTMLWQQSTSYSPSNLSLFTTLDIEETFRVNFDRTPVNYPTTHFLALFLRDFIGTCSGPNQIRADFGIKTTTSTAVDIAIWRDNNLKIVQHINMGILVVDISSSNVDLGFYTYSLVLDQPTLADKFVGRPTNFGIDEMYRKGDNFDGQCMVGTYKIRVPYQQTSTAFIDMTSYPINAYQTIQVSRGYKFMIMEFIFVCVLERYYGIQCSSNFGFQNCAQCTPQKCIRCQNNFVADNEWVQCRCIIGSLLLGICNTIHGCINPVILPDGIKSCNACNSTYFLSQPVNGKCICRSGTLINGICNTAVGCITPFLRSDGTIACAACNASSMFTLSPVNPSECTCKNGYELVEGICVEICGDGLFLSSGKHECDDGNLVNGDGCSQTCQVEPFYRCDTTLTPSLCLYVGIPLTLSLRYSERAGNDNKGRFVFSIYPPLYFLKRLTSHNINFLCSNDYKLTDVEYASGTLSIEAGYTTDMEQADCTLTINYNSSALIDDSNLYFKVISRNEKLLVVSEDMMNSKKKISFIFQILSYIVLGVFLISLGHSMIGVELVFTCQIIYVSYSLYINRSYLSQTITSFSLVTGYRSFSYSDQYKEMMYPFAYILNLSKQVLQNNLIWMAAILGFAVIYSLLLLYYRFKGQQQMGFKQSRQPFFSAGKWINYVFKCLIYPLTVFNILLTFLGISINSSRSLDYNGTFGTVLNGLSGLVMVAMPAWVLSVQIMQYRVRNGSETVIKAKGWYSIYYLLKVILVSFLVVVAIWYPRPFVLYTILCLYALNFIFLIILWPYKNIFCHLSVLFNELAVLYALGLASISGMISMSDETEIFMLIVLQGFIVLSLLSSMIRIGRHYYALCLNKLRGQSSQQNEGLDHRNNIQKIQEKNLRKAEPLKDLKEHNKHEPQNHLIRYLRKREQLKNKSIMRRVIEQHENQIQQNTRELDIMKQILWKSLLTKKKKEKSQRRKM